MGPVRTWVRELLAIAGIAPSAGELQELENTYPDLRRLLDRLHQVPEARYESPAVVFAAAVPRAGWGSIGEVEPGGRA